MTMHKFAKESKTIVRPKCEITGTAVDHIYKSGVYWETPNHLFINKCNGDLVVPWRVPKYLEELAKETDGPQSIYPSPEGHPLQKPDIFHILEWQDARDVIDLNIDLEVGRLNAKTCAIYIDDCLQKAARRKKLERQQLYTRVVCFDSPAIVYERRGLDEWWVRARVFTRNPGDIPEPDCIRIQICYWLRPQEITMDGILKYILTSHKPYWFTV